MATAPRRNTNAYKPGLSVPISGIYTVRHLAHRSDHQVLAIRGEEFPLCRGCQTNVNFYLTQAVPYMSQDFDLAGPSLQMPGTRAKTAGRNAL
jgi:hypothetical protein